MSTLLAHITIREGHEAAFESIIRRLYEATHRLEDTVIRYEYWRGEKPRSYYCLLAYPDFLSFIEHQVSDHHESASPELRPAFESFSLEWLDPVEGAAPLGRTVPQNAPEDAGELTKRYAKAFEVKMADWWPAG